MSTVDNNDYIQMFDSANSKHFGETATAEIFKELIHEYVPESQEIDFEEVKKSPNFKHKKYLDALYFGELI